MVRVLHIITTLNTGGAEETLCKLLSRMDAKEFPSRVLSLAPPGPVGERLARRGIPVSDLGMQRAGFPHGPLCRLARCLRSWRPVLVQTWLYHADLVGLAARAMCRARLVWNIRCAFMDFSKYRRTTRWAVALGARLSHLPDAVITNSYAARRHHIEMGYRPKRFEVIPNGFDTHLFSPDPTARADLRRKLGLPGDAECVGLVARFDPMKDHGAFLEAAGRVLRKRPCVHFILCGEGVDRQGPLARSPLGRKRDRSHVHFLGPCAHVERVMAGLDVLVSSSRGESFPNVVGEAMACGVPCVVTDVGDCASIVGETGVVVPPENPVVLARAMLWLLNLPVEQRQERGRRARQRIEEHYALDTVVARYEALYRDLASPMGFQISNLKFDI